jgi:hypothetical protein
VRSRTASAFSRYLGPTLIVGAWYKICNHRGGLVADTLSVSRMKHMAIPSNFRPLPLAVAALLTLTACGGGSGAASNSAAPAGKFIVTTSNLGDGVSWELNRLMEFEFNNAIDPDTVHFGTVIFSSSEVTQPVTGSFELKPGSDDKVLVFRPSCPTSNGNDNGAFIPGGYQYSVSIPTSTAFGADVLRDVKGRALSEGFSRNFVSPIGTGSSLFIDYVEGPSVLIDANKIDWPSGLNFFNEPDPAIRLHFNQAIDARDQNLNLQNLYVLYSAGEAGTANELVFPETNRLPGSLFIEENCTNLGSVVVFQVSGLLPPNRNLQVVIKRQFSDIAGQENFADILPPVHRTLSLAEYFDDAVTDWDATEVPDEYQDFFDSSLGIDIDAAMPLPAANFEDGFVQASFDFPGEFTVKDFVLNTGYSEITTDSQVFYTDSASTTFTLVNGVLNCRDFTIAAGSELRGRGSNPLVIYASGTVTIDGILNVSGNNAIWPTGLNSPQRPEGGAKGECGGGAGGTSSQEVFQETYRGSAGTGAFGFTGSGGQGGEGGFNQNKNSAGSYNKEAINNLAAGGGAGSFARTANVSAHWTRWTKQDKMPEIDKNYEADHVLFDNTATDPRLSGQRFPYVWYGGEPGGRGSSWNVFETDPNHPRGIFGMEDERTDPVQFYDIPGEAMDGQRSGSQLFRASYPWKDPLNEPNPLSNDLAGGQTNRVDNLNPFGWWNGHPTDGADGGKAGPSIFSNDGTTRNDFWGKRLNADGSVTKGELLIPWAGAGGGASGDMVIYTRNYPDEVTESFPEPNFPNGRISVYRKGAPGGGGGGQVQILAIGNIVLGPEARIFAKGGNGVGGESIGWTYGQVSGSGAGSGGHIVLSTASKLDISAIDLVDSVTQGNTNETVEGGFHYQIPIAGLYFAQVINAVGGRRGWAMSRVQNVAWETKSDDDGNDTYALGRGGAGGNGVVQIHVPNPATDILWPAGQSDDIRTYIHKGDFVNNDLDPDRLEEMMRLFAAPTPYALVPIFSAKSMFRGRWIDTGLAELRQPANGSGVDYPDYSSPVLEMMGFDIADGLVNVSSEKVVELAKIVSGSGAVEAFEFEARIHNASASFAGVNHFLLQPNLLRGYAFKTNEAGGLTYSITAASYDSSTDVLTLLTDPSDGSMAGTLGSSWAILPRFFRLLTNGAKDSMPDGTTVRIQFQGAEESALGSNEPGTPFPGVNSWVSDLSQLEGYRFIRYQVLFDIDANSTGVDLSSPRSLIDYIKVPFTW